MIGKPHRILDRLGVVAALAGGPLDEYDGEAENARGDDLSVGGVATGILADDDIDALLPQQVHFRLDGEGAAGKQILHARCLHRRIDRIDAAHEIMMLRRGVEGSRLLSADREEDAARLLAQCRNRLFDGGPADPAITLRFLPAAPFQPQQRNARSRACRMGIGRNLSREGMGGIDQEVNVLVVQIGRKPGHAAETAGAHGRRLWRWIDGAAGKRERDGKIGTAGKTAGKVAGFRRAAQYEDASLVHA